MAVDEVTWRRWCKREKENPSPPAVTNPDLLSEAEEILSNFKRYLLTLSVQRLAEWVRWLEAAVSMHEAAVKKQQSFEEAPPQYKWRYSPPEYKPGDVVMINFGIGIHTETSYPHPGVVLRNDWFTILVAPMTHSRKFGPMDVPTSFRGENGTIQVDQVRVVSKQRVLTKLGSVRGTVEYEKVQETIFKFHSPKFYDEVKTLRQDNDSLKNQLERLRGVLSARKKADEATRQEPVVNEARLADEVQALRQENVGLKSQVERLKALLAAKRKSDEAAAGEDPRAHD